MKFPKQIKKWRVFGRKVQLFSGTKRETLIGTTRVLGSGRPILKQRILWAGRWFLLVQA